MISSSKLEGFIHNNLDVLLLFMNQGIMKSDH